MKTTKYLFLSLVAITIASCGKEITEEELLEEAKLPEQKLELRASSGIGSELRVSKTTTIYASWNFNDDNIKWSVSNDKIITIYVSKYTSTSDKNSIMIQGLAQGTASVIAQVGDKQASIDVEVLPLADFKVKQTAGTYKMTYTYVCEYYDFYRAEWDFGNGKTYTAYSNKEYDGVYTYYSSSGTYNVTLSFYDKNGKLVDSYTKTVTVE